MEYTPQELSEYKNYIYNYKGQGTGLGPMTFEDWKNAKIKDEENQKAYK